MVSSISAGAIQNYNGFSQDTIFTIGGAAGNVSSNSNVGLEVYKSYFHNYLAEAIKAIAGGVSKEDLTSHLQSLIANDSENVDNSEAIAATTNLIGDFENLSRGGKYITLSSLSASNGYEA